MAYPTTLALITALWSPGPGRTRSIALWSSLGGAISALGPLLTAGYAAAIAKAVASAHNGQQITSSTEATLQKSFSSAANLAQQYPQYANQIIAAAKASFHTGSQWAYLAGIIAILLGAAIVFFLYPKRDEERKLLAEFHAEDTGEAGTAA